MTGRSYRADDPDLLLWVHNVEVHSFLAGYRAYGGGVTPAEADRYVSEMVRHAELVGLSAEDVPHTFAEVDRYLDRRARADSCGAGGNDLRAVPADAACAQAALDDSCGGRGCDTARHIRDLYGIPWVAPATPVVAASTSALLKAIRALFPPPPPVREALERAARLAA